MSAKIVGVGEIATLLADIRSIRDNLNDGTQSGGDIAAAANAAASVAAAMRPNPLYLGLAATTAGLQLAVEFAKFDVAMSTNNTDGKVDAILGILGATGGMIALAPSAPTKAIGVGIAVAAAAAKDIYKNRGSFGAALEDIKTALGNAARDEVNRGAPIWIDPKTLIDRGLIDPKTLLPKTVSSTIGNTPDPLVKTIKYVDPLILDLDGDGLEITRLNGDSSVKFDTDGDTVKTATAWAASDDGLLVLDLDRNGTIDSGAELFGDETVLASGKKAADGFAALRDLDKGSVVNGMTFGAADGVFDANDAQYASLRVWRDLNQDGISQTNELKTLADSGVASIKLTSTASNINYGDAILAQSGSFTRTDASTGQAGSFILAQNNFVRQFSPIVVGDSAKGLPALLGSGWVRDLQEAATVSPELIGLLNQAKNAETRSAYKKAVANLIAAWGIDSAYQGVSKQALRSGYGLILSEPTDAQEAGWMDMAVKASASDRNLFRGTLSTPDLTKFDAMRDRMVGDLERMAAYEAFTGYTFLSWSKVQTDAFNPPTYSNGPGHPVEVWVPFSQLIAEHRLATPAAEEGYIRVTIPTPPSGEPHLTTLWSRLVNDATDNLSQVFRLPKYLDEVNLNITDLGVQFDFAALNSSIASLKETNSYEGASLLMDLRIVYGDALRPLGWDASEQLRKLVSEVSGDAGIKRAFAEHGYKLADVENRTGSDGDDAYLGNLLPNIFMGENGDDLIEGAEGADTLYGGTGNDNIYGGSGDDRLEGGDGNDFVDGGAGDDVLAGGFGRDIIFGGDGDDYIQGGGDLDTLDGGAGADFLFVGGRGSATYSFGRGDGEDRVYAQTQVDGKNTLSFKPGVLPEDVSIREYFWPSDQQLESPVLSVEIDGTSDRMLFVDYFTGWRSLQEISFSNGAVLNESDINSILYAGTDGNDSIRGTNASDNIFGGDGDDILIGGSGGDVLVGGAGNDRIYGGAMAFLVGNLDDDNDTLDGGVGDDVFIDSTGNNTYLFRRGDGIDLITTNPDVRLRTDGYLNTLKFIGNLTPEEVTVSRYGADGIILTIRNSSDAVIVRSFFPAGGDESYLSPIHQVEFENGTIWNRYKLQQMSGAIPTLPTVSIFDGTSGNDWLTSMAGGSTIYGNGGNDFFNGGDGDDILVSGGIRGLHAEYFNNTAWSGAPALVREGEIVDFDWGSSPGPGISADNFSVRWTGQLEASVAGSYELLWYADDRFQVTIDGQTVVNQTGYTGATGGTSINLSKGSHTIVAQMSEDGGGAAARLHWKAPGDTGYAAIPLASLSSALHADAQADTFNAGAGNDTIVGSLARDSMTGGRGDDLYYVDNADDLVIENAGEGNDTVLASTGYVLASNVENLVLTGAARLEGAGNAGNNVLTANAAGSTLYGNGGSDIFNGGSGNDVLISGNSGSSSAQLGLRAEYFNNTDWSGAPVLVRNENVDFNWGAASPAAGINADYFSVRWSGQITAPTSGSYGLQWYADDRFQVTIDGQLVINQTDYTGATATTSISLSSGTHTIVAQLMEGFNDAAAQLRWKTPGSADYTAVPLANLSPAVPTAPTPGLRAEYFNNTNWSGTPVLVRNENVDFDWGEASPGPGVNSDYFSVRWTGQITAPTAGSYGLQWYADDRFQVTIDGQLVINQTDYTGATATTSIILSGGTHTIVAQLMEGFNGAAAQLRWKTPGSADFVAVPLANLSQAVPTAPTPGLRAEYFNNTNWSGTPVLVRNENVDFDWGDASPGAGVNADYFSARWTGQITAPTAGSYGLQWYADDRFQVTIDGQLVINQTDYTGATATTSISLSGGTHTIVAQLMEGFNGAAAQLRWKTPGSADFVAIPLNAFSSDAPAIPVAADAQGDIFDGGAGNDSLFGSSGDDTYRWGLGKGTDTITDAGGAMDHVDLFAGITRDQLHFTRNADALELQVTGQTDKLVVNGWYGSSSSTSRIEEFRLSNGDKVLAADVQSLVSAMAQFDASATASGGLQMRVLPAWRYDGILHAQN